MDSRRILKDIKAKRMTSQIVAVRIREDRITALTDICERENLKVSQVIQQLVEEFISGYRPKGAKRSPKRR